MHEHIGDKLVESKILGFEIMQCHDTLQVDTDTGSHHGSKEENDIKKKKVLGYRRYLVHVVSFLSVCLWVNTCAKIVNYSV